ncbi:hypothetical protein M3221_16375 [Domibacillus indicus]|uniref:hypothetical protein n=1 Tax=Domibacillus indicus TaxID=1437523 RepID=UPI00203A50C9|nr:hypothetical protein [Domibacillus indicus]MCM3789967.1 hypothetical protein [Domibacillus indicus]
MKKEAANELTAGFVDLLSKQQRLNNQRVKLKKYAENTKLQLMNRWILLQNSRLIRPRPKRCQNKHFAKTVYALSSKNLTL